MINTGPRAIPPNSCIYWDFPTSKNPSHYPLSHQKIKGHPEGAIYPEIHVYEIEDVAEQCAGTNDKMNILKILSKQERIIGWSLNHAEPGHQLDVILKR